MIPPVYYLLVTAAVSVNSFKLDPQYRSGEFLTSREHGLDTSNIFHMQQCLQSSGQFNKDLGAMRQHIKDWYMNLAGEHDVDKELCQQVHCAYDLRTCLHPSFTSSEFLEAIINASVEVCTLHCQVQPAPPPTTTAIASIPSPDTVTVSISNGASKQY
ncbi:hypothetical protein LSTR_LSTR011533 [Laodelphax striatellus]|uniref:Uncharacterized protein n=1 Tax=Laodelphax striatellus TaxID=195883 RepID=A0A482WFE7_LAOST|nr:hypothetical protein LSTR_LSTR011533 [Laodelphax striatellus]